MMNRSFVQCGCLAVALLGGAGCDPFHAEFEPVEDAVMYRAAVDTPVPAVIDGLAVMTWNIEFAGARLKFFWECGGERANMTRAEVHHNLAGVADKLNLAQPDILLLQEIDVGSKRSAFVDSVQWLLDHSHFNYAAYASQWRADVVPSDGVGRIDTGNAILSRWPIEDAQRIALPLISDQDAVTRYFYLRRNILKARIAPPGQASLTVFATHTSAFSDDGTKLEQIERVKEEMDKLDAAGEFILAGGDYNALPPGTARTHQFPDDCTDGRFSGDDYRGEQTWMSPLYGAYEAAVPIEIYIADSTPHFSFSGDENIFWSRKLDYMFSNGQFSKTLTHQDRHSGGVETLPLSDHAPLSSVLGLP